MYLQYAHNKVIIRSLSSLTGHQVQNSFKFCDSILLQTKKMLKEERAVAVFLPE